MTRALHRWPGLLALVLVMILAVSGAALSVFPAAERLSTPQAETDLTVAELAGRIQAAYPGVEQIRRAPSGRITAFWFDEGTPGAAVIDPATGQGISSADPDPVRRWLTNLHRSLFLGDAGRIAMAIGAAAMLVLSISGAMLVARRMGGWRRWFAQLRGPLSSRVHTGIARVAVIGLTLSSRRDYGIDVQAPTVILRFSLPETTLLQRLTGRGVGRFQAGDLLGILPEGADLPRLYSLASGRRDGFVEIVVRKRPGGLCSGQLLALEPGQSIRAFVRRNPAFHAGGGKSPLILIGAGTGIGPLAGFIRGNRAGRPVHLVFGMRHPDSDFLYGEELAGWQADGRLARLTTAISRGAKPRYVQDALRAESAALTRLIGEGARIMVCGGRDMAAGVAEALTDILAPAGRTPLALKAEGRYAEDVY